MFSLPRCCIGAALGLSLLACRPAYAKRQYPIYNGSFEHHAATTTLTGWKTLGNVKVTYTSATLPTKVKAATGHGFAIFQGGTTAPGPSGTPITGIIGQPIPTKLPPSTYVVSGSYYFGSGAGARGVDILLASGSSYTLLHTIATRTASNTGKYVHFTDTLKPTHNFSAVAFVGTGTGTGSIRLDHVNRPTPPPASNLLKNPGFELPTVPSAPPWGWNPSKVKVGFTSTLGIPSPFPGTAATGKGLAVFGSGTLGQVVTGLVPGASYLLSGWVAPGSNASGFIAGFGTSSKGTTVTSDPGLPVPTYFRFLGTVQAFASTEMALFHGKNTHSPMRLDDLALTRLGGPPGAPEADPRAGAPALALALGGLALMEGRRRRKRSGGRESTTAD